MGGPAWAHNFMAQRAQRGTEGQRGAELQGGQSRAEPQALRCPEGRGREEPTHWLSPVPWSFQLVSRLMGWYSQGSSLLDNPHPHRHTKVVLIIFQIVLKSNLVEWSPRLVIDALGHWDSGALDSILYQTKITDKVKPGQRPELSLKLSWVFPPVKLVPE